jgi:RHS repeat-associated protein
MRFPGQRFDVSSGLNYNYFRDYEPSTGRYIQSDPIGLHGGASTFSYGMGSPLATIDLLGLAETCRTEAARQTEWYNTGNERHSVITESKISGFCIPLAKFGASRGIDPSPDAGAYIRQRRFLPPGAPPLAIELFVVCRSKYLQTFMIMIEQAMVTANSRVCRDDCGTVTSQIFLNDYTSLQWTDGEVRQQTFWGVPTVTGGTW